MNKIDKTVQHECIYISIWVALLSIIMNCVFILLKRWDYTVLLGNLLGAFTAIVNFFLIGLSVQKAIGKDEKQIKNSMKFSMTLRMLLIAIVSVIGISFPYFNILALFLPLFFPRIAIMFRPKFDKYFDNNSEKNV